MIAVMFSIGMGLAASLAIYYRMQRDDILNDWYEKHPEDFDA